MTEIMLDIETCSTKPNAMILSIAAIKFSRITEITPELKNMETFYVRIDQKSCGGKLNLKNLKMKYLEKISFDLT